MEPTLVEKFILLAQHPEKGRSEKGRFTITGVQLWNGIIGALLIEMSLQKRIEIEDGKIVLKNDRKITDPIISEIVDMIKQKEKPKKIRYWLSKISKKANRYKKEILAEMVKNGFLQSERKRFLFIPYTLFYLKDKRTRDKMIRHLRKAALYPSTTEVTQDDVVLLGLIEAAKMHKVLTSDKDELKRIKRELKKVIEESPIAGVVDKTIKEMQGAIIASAVVVGAGR